MKLAIVALLLTSFAAGCARGQAKEAPAKPLIVTGSSTVAPVIGEIGKKYESLHPGARIDVQAGGSSRGIADARSGLASIGMISRRLNADEKDLQVYPLAKDGICVIVHADNPVSTLSDENVVAIYTGKVRNWSALGGADAPITVVNKAEGRSTLELFLHYYKLKNDQVRADVVIGDNEQGIKTVAGNPNAIGYVSIGTAEYDSKRGVKIKLLPMKGVSPSLGTVADGTFPLSRELNLVVKGKPVGLAAEFIAFATSEQSNDIIRAQSFVPIARK
ncbi:MAG: phosphate ABC transporter substrate-binding protein [Myxococcota bacterium]